MIAYLQHQSLKRYNTFGIDATASHFVSFRNNDELRQILSDLSEDPRKFLVLGGGSNILLTNDFQGLVMRNEMRGITVVAEDTDHVYVRAAAGENWHTFVMHCIDRGLAGLENLSLIPGSVGAAPMQNIGAYGVEIKDVFHTLEAVTVENGQMREFSAAECKFGYRESVFKRELKDKYIITSVTFRLSRTPRLNTSYGAIEKELASMGVTAPGIRDVSQAVINIRRSKLPDPAVTGNAGSFFKNPEIGADTFQSLKERYPDIAGYELPGHRVKVAAGWLIEKAGWKGFREGDAGVHPLQALVLVNYGTANGAQILELSSRIMDSVQSQFGITLEREVNII